MGIKCGGTGYFNFHLKKKKKMAELCQHVVLAKKKPMKNQPKFFSS